MVIALVFHARDEGARLVLDELERARAVDVLLVPGIAVLGEVLIRVDEVERRGHRRQERARRKLQFEDHRVVVGHLDSVDHLVEGLARRSDAFRREDDLVVGRDDIFCVQRITVMELDAFLDMKGVGQAVLTDIEARADIALQVGRVRRVIRVHADQKAVERRDRVDHAERGLDMAVIGRDLRADHDIQRATGFRCVRHGAGRHGGSRHRTQRKLPKFGSHQFLPGLLTVDFRTLSLGPAFPFPLIPGV